MTTTMQRHDFERCIQAVWARPLPAVAPPTLSVPMGTGPWVDAPFADGAARDSSGTCNGRVGMTGLEERAYRLVFTDRSHEHMFAHLEDGHRLTIERARACWNGLQAGLRSRCSQELGGSNPSARTYNSYGGRTGPSAARVRSPSSVEVSRIF